MSRSTLLAAGLALALTAAPHALDEGGATILTITSPLGRTGSGGTVRIVARVSPASAPLGPVRFFVDGELYKEDSDGAPYAVEWTDENPLERRELAVEATEAGGRVVRDTVVLQPFVANDKTEVFSVVLDAVVRDGRGRFVTNLPAESFRLIEDGVAQIPDLAGMESIPATFALLVDASQSMSRRYDFVRAAAGRLTEHLRPLDRVIVAPFAKEIGAVTGPTGDRETVVGAIGAIRPAGGTAIFDALKAMAERFALVEGRHDLILVTDGYDEHSAATFADAVEAVKRSQSTVYVVGVGGVAGISLRGERELKQLANETGGRAFFPPRASDLPGVYDQLAVDAQNRYVLSFTPTNQKQNGGWRAISLATTSSELVVKTRDGYFAPKAPPIRPTLEFSVIDAGDRALEVVREDVVVKEDGIEQKVETFQEADDPIQMILTLDESGSMKKSAEAVKAAAADFVRALRPADPLAVITFADKARFAHDIATNRDWSLEAIAKYRAQGGTALYDALHDSVMRLKPVTGRRAVVVMTDGRDENDPGTAPGSVHTLAEVMAKVKEVGALVFPIGMGPRVDRDVLTQLADISGGQAFFPADVTELPDQYRRVLENLRRRYVVGYASTNEERDGQWRAVEISLRQPGVRVRTRGGYFAPER